MSGCQLWVGVYSTRVMETGGVQVQEGLWILLYPVPAQAMGHGGSKQGRGSSLSLV